MKRQGNQQLVLRTGIRSQSVMVHDKETRRTDGKTGTAPSFEAHAGSRQVLFIALSRLEAATCWYIAGAADVVVPAASRNHVVQRRISHVHLRTRTGEGVRSNQAAWAFVVGGITH